MNEPVACQARAHAAVPFAICSVPAGFPSPAEDYMDKPLDFNELLIVHPAATFAVRVAGDSMTGAGIYPGDIAVVDRARAAKDKDIILAVVDGAFTLKRYRVKAGRCWLQPENPAYEVRELTEGVEFQVFGVVTAAVRMF